MLWITTHFAFIFEQRWTKIGLKSLRTFFKWFLKLVVQTSLIFVGGRRLIEIRFQFFFIELKLFIYYFHHTFVLQNFIAPNLDRSFSAAFEVVSFWNRFLIHLRHFLTDWNFENLISFCLFFETSQKLFLYVFWNYFFRLVEKTDLDILVNKLVIVQI